MQEEQVTCRICSAPAEPDQPLFHPCRCSGTIRYIHQDCLTTWLAHSKKKTCDICKHPYAFTKVYAPDMPERLPIVLLLRQLSRQAAAAVLFFLRAMLVGFVWLAVLPLATIWIWRMFFAMGDSAAWWISNRPRPEPGVRNVDVTSTNGTSPAISSAAQFGDDNITSIFSHPVARAISSDILSGQIIASLIVLAFVAIFLLREWISQNARPGVFDDAEVVAEEQVQPQPPPPPRIQPVMPEQVGVVRVRAANAPRREEPAITHVRGRRQRIDAAVVRRQAVAARESPNKRLRRAESLDEQRLRRRRVKGKRIERPGIGIGATQLHRWHSPGQSESNIFEGLGSLDEEDSYDTRARREYPRERTAEWQDFGRTSRPTLELTPEQARFTFRAQTPSQGLSSDAENADIIRDISPPAFTEHVHVTTGTDLSSWSRSIPDVPRDVSFSLSPEEDHFTSSFHRHDRSSESKGSDIEYASAYLDAPPSSSSSIVRREGETSSLPALQSEPSGSLRRPPLPSVTLPPSSGASSAAGIARSRVTTPLASPNLATYRPPEEFEAGPSTFSGYFEGEGHMQDEIDDMETEHTRYFAEPDEDDAEDDEERDVGGAEENDEEFDHWSDDDVRDAEEDDAQRDRIVLRVQGPNDLRDDAANGAALPAMENVNGDGRPPEQLDEMDVNLEDDMDGALEAIGLRGPLHSVLQNAALMIFILATAIGVGIWLPFTVGKSTALLSLDPPRFLQILHLPLRAIRIVTDPIVDGVLVLITQFLIPLVLRGLCSLLHKVAQYVGEDRAQSVIDGGYKVITPLLHAFDRMWSQAVLWLSSKPDIQQPQLSPSIFDRVLQQDSAVMRFIEPYFAPLGNKACLLVEEAKLTYLRLAIGSGPNEKVFAILLGYAAVGFLLALYLNILTIGNVRNAGRAVRNAVREQLLVIKVAAFVVIELVIFPLGCGIMLDACTVWLLPQGNFRSRAAFSIYAPVTSIFYHWVIGTMFMYQFAVLLAGCRGIMRPGSMWFIKNPQDQNFHPIRDILERPTLVQVRKLLMSAVMYGIVVAAGVGTVSGVLQIFSRTILPFRWKIREPLSVVPVDLLFLHFVLPHTMQYFRPKKTMRQFGIYLWKHLAAQLRLTSYMFGGRYINEEYTSPRWSWRSRFIKSKAEMADTEAVFEGTFRRVPNSDNIALVKDMPATAIVDADGTPVDDEQARLIALQNAEAEKAKRSIKDDYAIVYTPPNLKYRIMAFILCVWLVGSVILALVLGAPILIGRCFFRLFVTEEVHDGYSFIAGFYLLWACLLVVNSIERTDRRRQRKSGNGPRADLPLYLAKRGLLWTAKITYMGFFLGFVIPTLLAIVMEFYVVRPVRQFADPPMEPRIKIVDMWAYGLLYSKILLRCMRMQPGNDLLDGIDRIRRQGLMRPDVFRATREVIGPTIIALLGMIFLPAGMLWGVRKLLLLPIADDFLFVHVYPSIFTVAGFAHALLALSRVINSWSQSIRDKEFLVEMRLQNHEPEPMYQRKVQEEKQKQAVAYSEAEVDADADADLREDEEEEED
ncbi:uncharacterized protein LAESUDRAFT_694262 [Laetiporus sulphureus 93-53]|uniref:RING-type E3 ubiquitin transferase n=1 Tax=Laetiporus sulphureus 93-53 TaxID=1314785 RepID=A0A165G4L0_9APHY|nr:uncharacterized protein LAESUDRAFT_694262 [Laetiporus sulphureus 93-53]KZT09822.1 hypothetical protein LAESUDRAFT_694262 [Laetiporus sulphureus 93-53]